MAGQATESERKNAGVAKPKNLCSGYPQSDGIRSEKQWQRKDLVGCGFFEKVKVQGQAS
jgi:hypothetical protein